MNFINIFTIIIKIFLIYNKNIIKTIKEFTFEFSYIIPHLVNLKHFHFNMFISK